MLNLFVANGRIVAKPELKTTSNGDSTAMFSLAINRDNSDKTDFFDCIAFNKTAENICKYTDKGDLINITGSIQTQTANNKKYTNVKISRVYFINTKNHIDNDCSDVCIPEESR